MKGKTLQNDKLETSVCFWREYEDGSYTTSCGRVYAPVDDSRSEKCSKFCLYGARFCLYCGKPLIKQEMFVYCVAPIDHWNGWRRLDETENLDPDNDDGNRIGKQEVEQFLHQAQIIAAIQLGWEGDVRGCPFWVPIPNVPKNYWPVFMVAWKQDNNGTTFVASPFAIPQFDGEEFAHVR